MTKIILFCILLLVEILIEVKANNTTDLNCPEKPDPVKNLNVTAESFNIGLTWFPPEDENCIDNYIIYLDNNVPFNTSNTDYLITNLNACQGYSIEVGVVYNGNIGYLVQENVNTTVPILFDYSVEEAEANLISSSTLNITWDISEKVLKCVTSYYVIIWDSENQDNVGEYNSYVTYLELQPVIACMNYSIMLYPKVGELYNGISKTIDYYIHPLPTNPPNKKSITTEKTSVIITWEVEELKKNKCELLQIRTICLAIDNENSDWDWIERNITTITDITDSNPRPRYIIIVDGLSEFTNYTCNGFVINIGGESDPSEDVKFQTNEEVPGPPENVVVDDLNSYNFTIQWSQPKKIPGILLNYCVHIESIQPEHYVQDNCLDTFDEYIELNIDKYEYQFDDASPDYTYSISVFGIVSVGNGSSSTVSTTTNTSTPQEPVNLSSNSIVDENNVDYYNVSEEIFWELPCNTNGPLDYFDLLITDQYNEITVNHTIDKNDNIEDINYNYTLMNMDASYTYKIYIKAVLMDGTEGDSAFTEFKSPDGYPGPPVLRHLTNITENGFEINWDKPSEPHGTIINYIVNIQSMGPAYSTQEGCKFNNNLSTEIVDANITSYTYLEALPYFKYNVYINASTSVGFGHSSTLQYLVTKEAEPENIQNLQVNLTYSTDNDEYDGKVEFSFEHSCYTNGPFKNYELKYIGQRDGFPIDIDNIYFNNSYYTISLKPDYYYKCEIFVITANFSTSTLTNFTSKPGVPLIINEEINLPITNETQRAFLILSRNLFNNNNGEISYYCLILTKNLNYNNIQNYGYWDNTEDTWPKSPNFTQITENFWNPFKEGIDEVSFIVGNDNSCSHDYCNKRLEEDTEYLLIIRIFTSFGYRDSNPLRFRTVKEDTLDLALILGLLFGLLFVIILIIFTVILWRRRQRMFIDKDDIIKETPTTNIEEPLSISVKKFISHYDELKNNYSIIRVQFTNLDMKSKESSPEITYAVLPENRRKNRYTNILPFDCTRVKLHIDEDDEIASDYINASYIKGYSGKVEYIATQGPLETTCRDFWKMILQENVSVIVMVSQFIEQSKEKCYKYFPNNHETLTFGNDVLIKCCSELHFGTYCVRTLEIKMNNIERSVVHLQYLNWPDFGVPLNTDSILQFCNQMRERMKNEDGLITLHCSAGVGRTGALITIDILLQTIENQKDIDIYKIVSELRKQRINMVQTEKQYMFIHTCVRDVLENPNTSTYIIEPIYENLEQLKSSSIEENLISNETESAL